jgi:hypothetical protein
VVGLLLALPSASADAKTFAECNAEYAANKEAIKATGQTEREYLIACRGETASAAASGDAPASAPPAVTATSSPRKTLAQCREEYAAKKDEIKASRQSKRVFLASCRAKTAPAPAPTPMVSASSTAGKSFAQCNAEYAKNKEAIKAGRQTRRAFLAACRAGTDAAAPRGGALIAPSTSSTPDRPVAASVPPIPPLASPVPASGPGMFMTTSQAQAHCPSDIVVWVDTMFGVYHFASSYTYGKLGGDAFMCEADATGAGYRAFSNAGSP